MGIWTGRAVYKKDVIVAKNYLSVEQIEQLERTVSSFFDYIERILNDVKHLL